MSHVLAQVLVRRGLGDAGDARAFLAAEATRTRSTRSAACATPPERILGHVGRGSRITVHGDYDVDGVCSTAVLVRALRTLGADVDWYLPSRIDDGYGLAARHRRAARRPRHATCWSRSTARSRRSRRSRAARAAGIDVVVTDHHAPRADGALPDAPIVHPAVGGYPVPGPVRRRRRATSSRRRCSRRAGEDPARGRRGPRPRRARDRRRRRAARGENRRLVRAGLRALASTRKPGLRALMDVARVDPSGRRRRRDRLPARAAHQRRRAAAPRRRGARAAADRGRRARAAAIAARARRRQRRAPRRRDPHPFEAEAQVAELGRRARRTCSRPRAGIPGVIGIVASRIAERHHRPAVLIALDGDEGTGSGRSIPAFDLLGGLDAAQRHLLRHGGHRAAAGLTIAREHGGRLPRGVRAHAAAVLRRRTSSPSSGSTPSCPATRSPRPRRGARAARAVRAWATRSRRCSCPARAARRSARDGGGPPRRVHARRRAARARAASRFGAAAGCRPSPASRSTPPSGSRSTATTAPVEPRLVLRHAQPPRRAGDRGSASPARRRGSPPSWRAAWPPDPDSSAGRTSPRRRRLGGPPPRVRDSRGGGIAGLLGDLVASGEPVLAVPRTRRTARGAARPRSAASPSARGPPSTTIPAWPPASPISWPSTRRRTPICSGCSNVRRERWAHLAWGSLS